jgi:hypothetical protein
VELGDDAFEHAEGLGDAALEALQRFARDAAVERGLAPGGTRFVSLPLRWI